MTITEMHLALDVAIDSIATLAYPGMEPEEKDIFLNRAIERFVKTRYSGYNPKNESVEQTQKRIDDIRTLVVRNASSNSAVTQLNASEWTYDLPDGTPDPKYFLLLRSNLLINKDECGNDTTGRRIFLRQVTHDQLEDFLDDPYHKPDFNEAFLLFEGNKIHIITNGLYDVEAINITYLTFPVQVNITTPTNCDLPEHTHQEIVDIAVRLYIAAVGDNDRFNTESQTIKEQE
jgi:hypothetical protein